VTPTLAARLAEAMSQCAFACRPGRATSWPPGSATRDLDIAICAAPQPIRRERAHLLVRDPYILAVPRGTVLNHGLAELSHLSFLRRDMDQLMGQQIEAYLSG
jgi:DNA-binding transcriptional LysR family regulator